MVRCSMIRNNNTDISSLKTPLSVTKYLFTVGGPNHPPQAVFPEAAIQLFSHHLCQHKFPRSNVLDKTHSPHHGIVVTFCASQLLLTRLLAQGDSRYQAIYRDRTAEGCPLWVAYVFPAHSILTAMLVAARIKKIAPANPGAKERTKFKIRCSRYLYTLAIDDPEKAEKLKQSLPPGETHFASLPPHIF